MSLRRVLDEALDPGPEFPSPALAYRIAAALDEPTERRPPRTRQVAAGLAVLVLAGLVVGTLLISRTAGLHRSNQTAVPGSTPLPLTTQRGAPLAGSAAGYFISQSISPQVTWVAQFAPSGVTHVSRSLNGGGAWTEVEQIHGLGFPPYAQFFSPDDAVVVGPVLYPHRFGIRVYATSDGVQWTVNEAPTSVGFMRKAYFFNSREGWLLTTSRQNAATDEPTTLWHTSDAGAHWVRLTDFSTVPRLSDSRSQLAFDSRSRGWLYSADFLLRSTDGGRSWQSTYISPSGGSIQSIGRPQANLMQVTTTSASSYVYRTADEGQTWTPVRRLPHGGSAVFLSDLRWVIQGQDGFDVTDDGGLTFAAARAPVPTGWHLWPPLVASGEIVTAAITDLPVGQGGRIANVFALGGSAPAGSTEPMDMKIQGTPPRFAFVRSLDGGRTWSAVSIPDRP